MARYRGEITSYKVFVRTGLGRESSRITFYHGNSRKGQCVFYEDGDNIPRDAGSADYLFFYFPTSRFSWVLDILRNEKPVYYYFDTIGIGCITTDKEPVGEEEEEQP